MKSIPKDTARHTPPRPPVGELLSDPDLLFPGRLGILQNEGDSRHILKLALFGKTYMTRQSAANDEGETTASN